MTRISNLSSTKGLLRCAAYALSPNVLHYCGPKSSEPGVYKKHLEEYLQKFETLFPYLKLIAKASGIRDPFDERVVEAYWLGNNLLNMVSMNDIYRTLVDEHHLKNKLSLKMQKLAFEKIPLGAKPHHSFHVLNIFIRTGHDAVKHTIKTMDSCRIAYGRIVTASEAKQSLSKHQGIATVASGDLAMTIRYRPLIYKEKKLQFGERQHKIIKDEIKGQAIVPNLKAGDLVSFHWGMVCEKITNKQAKNLNLWTKYHLNLANLSF